MNRYAKLLSGLATDLADLDSKHAVPLYAVRDHVAADPDPPEETPPPEEPSTPDEPELEEAAWTDRQYAPPRYKEKAEIVDPPKPLPPGAQEETVKKTKTELLEGFDRSLAPSSKTHTWEEKLKREEAAPTLEVGEMDEWGYPASKKGLEKPVEDWVSVDERLERREKGERDLHQKRLDSLRKKFTSSLDSVAQELQALGSSEYAASVCEIRDLVAAPVKKDPSAPPTRKKKSPSTTPVKEVSPGQEKWRGMDPLSKEEQQALIQRLRESFEEMLEKRRKEKEEFERPFLATFLDRAAAYLGLLGSKYASTCCELRDEVLTTEKVGAPRKKKVQETPPEVQEAPPPSTEELTKILMDRYREVLREMNEKKQQDLKDRTAPKSKDQGGEDTQGQGKKQAASLLDVAAQLLARLGSKQVDACCTLRDELDPVEAAYRQAVASRTDPAWARFLDSVGGALSQLGSPEAAQGCCEARDALQPTVNSYTVVGPGLVQVGAKGFDLTLKPVSGGAIIEQVGQRVASMPADWVEGAFLTADEVNGLVS